MLASALCSSVSRTRIGGLGRIVGPEAGDLYKWISRGRLEAMGAVALLWEHLGPVRRQQANAAIKRFLSQYECNPSLARSGRHVRAVFALLDLDVEPPANPQQLELAWAAGFLEGEGYFGCVRSTARVREPQWYGVRGSATQRGEPGIVPEVLQRLQRALGGMGRIERHSGVDTFKWVVEGDTQVEAVVERLAPYVGERKVAQARQALAAFRAQVRLKGNATHCVRGHEYSYVAMRSGRIRRICNPCARLQTDASARNGVSRQGLSRTSRVAIASNCRGAGI